jgi:AI-2E family transporter
MSATLQRVLHRLDEQDVAISEIAPADHDRVVRYSLMGILTLLVMATLWVAQVITIPIVAGIIFGLVLGPTVDWLAEHGIPRVIAAALIGGLASMAVLSIAALIVTPVALMSDQLPAIVAALRAKLQIFLDIISRFEGTLTNGVTPAANEGVTAIPFMNIALSSSAVLSGFLIFVFTVFSWLATRRQLKARILRLCLGHNVRLSAAACFEDIEDRLATYFGVVTLINLVMGCICGAIGVSVRCWPFDQRHRIWRAITRRYLLWHSSHRGQRRNPCRRRPWPRYTGVLCVRFICVLAVVVGTGWRDPLNAHPHRNCRRAARFSSLSFGRAKSTTQRVERDASLKLPEATKTQVR